MCVRGQSENQYLLLFWFLSFSRLFCAVTHDTAAKLGRASDFLIRTRRRDRWVSCCMQEATAGLPFQDKHSGGGAWLFPLNMSFKCYILALHWRLKNNIRKEKMNKWSSLLCAEVLQELWNRPDLLLPLALPEVFATVCLSAFLGEVK